MQHTLPDPFYYLDNFQRALDWVTERHAHLLSAEEHAFAAGFHALPRPARALLVRMVMRKGSMFRASKLRYAEIGCAHAASAPLVERGWIDENTPLTLEELFALLTKPELTAAFKLAPSQAALAKSDLLEHLRTAHPEARPFADWWPQAQDKAFNVLVDPLCTRIRLLFFGNAWQDWSEFVLAELGVYRYEAVELTSHSFAFRCRADVDTYLLLHQCRERLASGEEARVVLAAVPQVIDANPWLQARHAKLLFALGQQLEREGELEQAHAVYAGCTYPDARVRRIRVLERLERHDEAWDLACTAHARPENEGECQQLARIMPRLRRKLGLEKPVAAPSSTPVRLDYVLPPPADGVSVEQALALHLKDDAAPVHYVENTLFNSLFGLLCWRAVFAPLPGAFFHPFHTGPADLHAPDFVSRRADIFSDCLRQLDNGQYRATIRQTYEDKFGIVSPFVAWHVLDQALLELALDCIPPAHLKACFERMLFDLRANCAGLPDLIQFYPHQKTYRMIEVKGPGDRLQDNQIRWLDYFARHRIPVAVAYVQWEEPS